MLFAVVQALPAQRDNPRFAATRLWLAGTALLNAAWIAIFDNLLFGLSAVVIVLMLVVALVMHRTMGIGRVKVYGVERFVRFPFSLYAGWLTVATIVNVAGVLAVSGWDGFGLPYPVWGVVMLLVAAAIVLESPGPVLFRQTRVGRGNAMFNILKFRSMRAEASDMQGRRSTGRGDDRITRVGAFIRRTSIDELPKLINVIRSEMSIVGPRPHALGSLAGDKLFWEVDGRYWHRHACKPGLTGLAQVRGFRGATHLEDDLVNRLQADLEYLENWSIWRDFKIILMTFQVIIHRNAY